MISSSEYYQKLYCCEIDFECSCGENFSQLQALSCHIITCPKCKSKGMSKEDFIGTLVKSGHEIYAIPGYGNGTDPSRKRAPAIKLNCLWHSPDRPRVNTASAKGKHVKLKLFY